MLFTGDRLLAVNGTSIQGASLTDAHSLLRSAGISTTLTIEYDLNNVEALRSTGRPLRVELSHPANCKSLGLSLTDCVSGVGGIVVVTQVTPASLADRFIYVNKFNNKHTIKHHNKIANSFFEVNNYQFSNIIPQFLN